MKPNFSRQWQRALTLVAAVIIGSFTGSRAAAEEPVAKDSAAPAVKPATLPRNLAYELGQVAKMAEAGVPEPVLTAYVEHSKYVTAPTAEEIVYLRERGVSDRVIMAAIQKTQRPNEPTPAVAATATPTYPAPAASLAMYTAPVATQPTIVYPQPTTVYVQPQSVYVTPPVTSSIQDGYGYGGYRGYSYGYCSPYSFQPYYYAPRYNYCAFPGIYPAFAGVNFSFRFGGGGFHHHHR